MQSTSLHASSLTTELTCKNKTCLKNSQHTDNIQRVTAHNCYVGGKNDTGKKRFDIESEAQLHARPTYQPITNKLRYVAVKSKIDILLAKHGVKLLVLKRVE